MGKQLIYCRTLLYQSEETAKWLAIEAEEGAFLS